MARNNGRKLKIALSADGGTTYVTVAAVTSKSIAKANEAVDVTTDDDSGWRTLLAEPATRTVDLSVSGVMDDDGLLAKMSANTSSIVLEDCRVTYEDGATDKGTFFLSSFSVTGETAGAITFEASLQSSGIIIYAAGT